MTPRVPGLWLGLLGLVLVWTRLGGLDQSLVHDEVFTVVSYVDRGPSGTLFGAYEPNDHVLFNLLTWATTLVVGKSEALFRLWSVLPGLAAVAILAWWSWRRLGAWTAVVFVFLEVTSPLHLELFKQARGYGLTALAASLMLVTADYFIRESDRRSLAIWVGAAFGGLYTHAAFALAFLGQAAALAVQRERRRPALIGSGIAVLLALVFYAPLIGQIVGDFFKYYAAVPHAAGPFHASLTPVAADAGRPPLPWHGVVSGPLVLAAPNFELFFTGASRPQCEAACFEGANLGYTAIPGVLSALGIGALWRRERQLLALILAPIVLSFLVPTVGRIFVADRFMSHLLLYVELLMAVGAVTVASFAVRVRLLVPVLAIAAASLSLVALVRLSDLSNTWVATPFENFKGVGEVVNSTTASRVLTNSERPLGLQYYVGDRLEPMAAPQLEPELCAAKEPIVYVEHFVAGAVPVDKRCLEDRGATKVELKQRGRGGKIDVWLVGVPARSRGGAGG